MSTAELLTAWETCDRKGAWTQQWESQQMHPTRMLMAGIRAGLLESERDDYPETAGEAVMQLAAERGLDTKAPNHYDCALHHAVLADIITSHLRKPSEPAWTIPEPVDTPEGLWQSSALLSASGSLTRLVLVDHWTDDRHLSEYHSWYCLGEVVAYQRPMTQIVIVLGASRSGKRHSPWSKGLLHPSNKKLRFRKRQNSTTSGFSTSWIPVWREEQDQIPRETWLRAMEEDGVLAEVAFQVEIPVASESTQARVRSAWTSIQRKVAQEHSLLPPMQLSTCDVSPCQFRRCCWGKTFAGPEAGGYINIAIP